MILKFWKSILWTFFIAFLLFLPGDKLPKNNLFNLVYFDKIVHFVLFIFLELLILVEGQPSGAYIVSNKIKLTICALGYALLTELMQVFFMRSRHGSLYDFIADAAGIISGLVIFWMYKKITIRVSFRKR